MRLFAADFRVPRRCHLQAVAIWRPSESKRLRTKTRGLLGEGQKQIFQPSSLASPLRYLRKLPRICCTMSPEVGGFTIGTDPGGISPQITGSPLPSYPLCLDACEEMQHILCQRPRAELDPTVEVLGQRRHDKFASPFAKVEGPRCRMPRRLG